MTQPKMERTRYSGIYKRNGSKRATYYVVEYVPGDEGKPKQRWHSGYRTLAEARSAQTEIRDRKFSGTYVAPSKITVREFIQEEWLPGLERSVRPSTFQSYRSNMRRHVIPAIGSTQLRQVTPGALNKLYGELEEKGLKARTVRYVHTILRRALQDALRQNLLVRNPSDAASPPSPSQAKAPRMQTWTAEELRRFLDHVRKDRLYPAWRLAAMTGVRRGELLGLKWRDVDLDVGRVTVAETLIGARESSTPKTDAGRRTIDLDPVTVAALRAHRSRQAEEKLALGPAYDDLGLVFCSEGGAPFWPRTLSRQFEAQVKAAELPKIPLKNLRHTHATLLLAAGVPPKVIQERLGHSNISITLDTYASAIPAMHVEATEKAAALIDG
jgi:integrase